MADTSACREPFLDLARGRRPGPGHWWQRWPARPMRERPVGAPLPGFSRAGTVARRHRRRGEPLPNRRAGDSGGSGRNALRRPNPGYQPRSTCSPSLLEHPTTNLQQQSHPALRGELPESPALAERLFSASENGGHYLRVTASMQDGNHPQRLFIRRVGNQVLAHQNEAQGP